MLALGLQHVLLRLADVDRTLFLNLWQANAGLMASTASHADAQTVAPRPIPTKNPVFRPANGQSFR